MGGAGRACGRSRWRGALGSLQELLTQQRALQRLVARNADVPAEALLAHVESGGPTPLQLPFIIIQARTPSRPHRRSATPTLESRHGRQARC